MWIVFRVYNSVAGLASSLAIKALQKPLPNAVGQGTATTLGEEISGNALFNGFEFGHLTYEIVVGNDGRAEGHGMYGR